MRRDTSITRGTSITGGITTMTSGASIIGVIDGTTATIGHAATAGAIAADKGLGSLNDDGVGFHARAHSCSVVFDAFAAIHA